MVFCERHGEQPALPTRFERVEQPEGQGVVDVVAHVGIEDHVDRRGDGR